MKETYEDRINRLVRERVAANTRTNLPTDEQLAEVHWQLRWVTAQPRRR